VCARMCAYVCVCTCVCVCVYVCARMLVCVSVCLSAGCLSVLLSLSLPAGVIDLTIYCLLELNMTYCGVRAYGTKQPSSAMSSAPTEKS